METKVSPDQGTHSAAQASFWQMLFWRGGASGSPSISGGKGEPLHLADLRDMSPHSRKGGPPNWRRGPSVPKPGSIPIAYLAPNHFSSDGCFLPDKTGGLGGGEIRFPVLSTPDVSPLLIPEETAKHQDHEINCARPRPGVQVLIYR